MLSASFPNISMWFINILCRVFYIKLTILGFFSTNLSYHIATKKDTKRTAPIFRPVTFLLAPRSDPYNIIILDVQVASLHHHNNNDVWVSSSIALMT